MKTAMTNAVQASTLKWQTNRYQLTHDSKAVHISSWRQVAALQDLCDHVQQVTGATGGGWAEGMQGSNASRL